MGIETVLDLLMHYPRRYVDRRHQSEIGLARRGRGGPGHRDRAPRLDAAHQGRQDDGPDPRRRRDGGPHARVLQPAVAGQAARRRLGGRRLRANGDLPGRPPDDEPGRRPRRRPDRPARARSTRSRARRRSARPRSPRTSPKPWNARGSWPRSCHNLGSTSSPSRDGPRHSGASTHRRPSRSASAPAAALPSTSCSGSSSSSS